jgi:hypothetical protein
MAAFAAFRGQTNNATKSTAAFERFPALLGGGTRVHRGFAELGISEGSGSRSLLISLQSVSC